MFTFARFLHYSKRAYSTHLKVLGSIFTLFHFKMIPATLEDKPLIIDILTESFDANKSVNYVVKQDHKRIDRIRGLMAYSFDNCFKYGQIWLNEEKAACALIMGEKSFSFQALIWDLKFAINVAGGLSTALKASSRESLVKQKHPDTPFLYLWFIGVLNKNQGQGLGTKLFHEIEAFNKNTPVYLETSTQRNLPFYKRLGFETFHEIDLSYKLYMMRKVYSA